MPAPFSNACAIEWWRKHQWLCAGGMGATLPFPEAGRGCLDFRRPVRRGGDDDAADHADALDWSDGLWLGNCAVHTLERRRYWYCGCSLMNCSFL